MRPEKAHTGFEPVFAEADKSSSSVAEPALENSHLIRILERIKAEQRAAEGKPR
jgi:hypothetical protein